MEKRFGLNAPIQISTQIHSHSLKGSVSAIYGRAALMGLRKSAEYLAGPEACRLRNGDSVGARTRFSVGHAPANKGLRRPGYSPGPELLVARTRVEEKIVAVAH